MEIYLTISNTTVISPLSRQVAEVIRPLLTMENPQWHANNRQGYSNKGVPSHIECYRHTANRLEVPRGFTQELITILKSLGMTPVVTDLRRSFPPLGLKFRGDLRPYQEMAKNKMTVDDFGVICSPTRSGKTVMALAIAAERDQPFTVIVHTQELMDQWAGTAKQPGAIETFLGIKPGVVGGGKFKPGPEATVAMVNTLYLDPARVTVHTGLLIQDECHRSPARMFREAVTAFDCQYMLGVSATPYRADGLTNLIHWYIGPQMHEVDRKTLEEQGYLLQAVVIPRATKFSTDIRLAPPGHSKNYRRKKKENDEYGSYSTILSSLTSNEDRNMMIARDAAGESVHGTCLILTDRKAHARLLTEIINGLGVSCECLVGDSKDRREIVALLNSGKAKVVAATGQLIGEGFDCRALHAAFLAMPIKAGKTEAGGKVTRFLQYVGRVLTPAPGKDHAVIYDYVDKGVPSLMRSWRSRGKEYRELGWEIRRF